MAQEEQSKYYIVRSYSAGVFFGQIVAKNGDEVVMNDCRKIHYWDGAAAVEQLAVDGVSKPENCRITVSLNNSVINNWIQILPCTQKSIDSLQGVPVWKK